MENNAQFDWWEDEPSVFDLLFFHVANRLTEDAEANQRTFLPSGEEVSVFYQA